MSQLMRTAPAFLIAMLLTLNASSASAEQYVIGVDPRGSGSTLALDFEGDMFRFVGEGFTITQDAVASVGLFFPRLSEPSCDPCRPGDIYNPGFRTLGEVLLGTGRATFGSTTYADLTFYGTLDLDVSPLSFPDPGGDGFRLSTPFAFNGSLRGAAGNAQAFAGGFTGRGLVLRLFDRSDDGRYFGGENQTIFMFEATDPAAVPEPATMLLVGAGASIAALARRRRPGRQPTAR